MRTARTATRPATSAPSRRGGQGYKIKWYSTGDETDQLNTQNNTYRYLAFEKQSEPGINLLTKMYSESEDIVWLFNITEESEISENSKNITITISRDGTSPTWSAGRYVTYEVINADGGGTTTEALVHQSAGSPFPTFTVLVSNIKGECVGIIITDVST